MKKAINLADINQDGFLLVKKKDVWIAPGGKLKIGESDYDCLHRELGEELLVTPERITIHNYYGSFIDKTPHSNEDLEAKVYFGSLSGLLKPFNEILDYTRVGKDNMNKYIVSLITKKILNSLIKDGYLK